MFDDDYWQPIDTVSRQARRPTDAQVRAAVGQYAPRAVPDPPTEDQLSWRSTVGLWALIAGAMLVPLTLAAGAVWIAVAAGVAIAKKRRPR